MKIFIKSIFLLLFILSCTFSCNKKPLKLVEENQILIIDSISDTKRIPDSTKIAFGEIEFDMTLRELLQTTQFKKHSENDLIKVSLQFSLVVTDKFKKSGMSDFLLLEKGVFNRNDVELIKTVDQIGLYEYDVYANLFRDSLYMVIIKFTGDDKLKNLFDIISSKYKITKKFEKKELELTRRAKDELSQMTEQDHFLNSFSGRRPSVDDYKSIPKPYMLYLWYLKNNRNICVFHKYETFRNYYDHRVYNVSDEYIVEIYNENILNDIFNYFRESLKRIEDENKIKKINDALKF